MTVSVTVAISLAEVIPVLTTIVVVLALWVRRRPVERRTTNKPRPCSEAGAGLVVAEDQLRVYVTAE